ncbi:MAG: aspartate aminotransferase family protein [Syntrophothermus sp.]
MTDRDLFFRYLGLPSRQPLGLEIVKAEGIWLEDNHGKKYLDLVSGISVSNIGHRHPAVLKAILDQTEKYLYLSVYGEIIQSPQVRFAQKLTEFLPAGLTSVYFVNSGSEAIEGAMKLAKRYTGRTEIISFQNAYHGSTQGALSILGNENLKNAFRPLLPGNRTIRFNNIPDLSYITCKTAAVVTETIQAEAGIILPEDNYLEKLSQKCRETGTLLIVDDIQMGFGRTGKLFSFEHFGIRPDILVLAKAMGGGMPIGAFISSPGIMDKLTFDPELGHITTFGGHPVSCAAGLASLEVLTSGDLLFQVEQKGAYIESKLQHHPQIKQIRRKGMMTGIDLKDPSRRKSLSEACLKNGIIIDWFLFQDATFRIAPPLVINREELETACNLMVKSLNEI